MTKHNTITKTKIKIKKYFIYILIKLQRYLNETKITLIHTPRFIETIIISLA